MSDRKPVDWEARRRIRQDLNTTLFVEAGAGTGKTSSLVSRVVGLVRSGVPVGSIVAITFTEMAAAELVDRVRRQLDDEVLDASTPAIERERLMAALDALDAVPMQTIHAFARRVLASFPVAASLTPRFEVVDQTTARLEFDERWDAFLDEFLGTDGPLDELAFLYALGLRTDGLKDLAWALHENWDRIGSGTELSVAGAFDESRLRQLRDELAMLLDDCRDRSDRLAQRIESILQATAPALSSPSQAWRLRLWSKRWSHGRSGSTRNWLRPGSEVRRDVATLDEQREHILRRHAGQCLEVVMHHLAAFVRRYADERREAGRLEFHDLLVHARDLLRANPEVRRVLHGRYQRILIDEFQDTDPLQIEIAALIARDPNADPREAWNAVPPPAGSLFVVGDPKQSIYRFRRADIELYGTARDGLGGERVSLVENFRSLPPIIAWVNSVFPGLMPPAGDPGQAVYEELSSWKQAPGAAGGVFHIGGLVDQNADAARVLEARSVAEVIADLCSGRARINDDGQERPIRRSDIAILFPSRTMVPPLENALDDALIPYRVESQSLIYASQEASDLYAILETLVDPTDEVALVAALRSAAFACSDVDLYRHRAAGGRWDYLRTGTGVEGPVSQAMEWLRDMRAAALTDPVNVTVDRIITGRRLFESAMALRRPRQRWQRYRFLLEQARLFAGRGGDLRQFVAWLKAQRDADARAMETAAPESDDDAVRLLTIHAAKGLEFPVVILAGLASGPSPRRTALLFTAHGVEASIGSEDAGIRTDGYEAARERDDELDRHESARELYVAATRARDILVVSLFMARRAPGPLLAMLLSVCSPDDASTWSPYPLGSAPAEEETGGSTPELLTAAHLEAWRSQRAERIQQLANGNAVAATALAHLAPAFEPYETRNPMDDARPWRRGRAGTSIGRAVHAVLQVIDLATGEGIDAAAGVQAAAEGVPERADEIAALVRAALSAPSVREALTAGRWWREVFVSAPVEGRLLEGFVDLVFERADGLVVVDYKTDAIRSATDADAMVLRYRLQVAAYALALEANLSKQVAECRLLFVSGRTPVERTLPDLSVAREEVRRALASGPVTAQGRARGG